MRRNTTLLNIGISDKRYKELRGFCEQYPEWKEAVDNPDAHPLYLARLAQGIKTVEGLAKMAAGENWEYLLRSVCCGCTIRQLQEQGLDLDTANFVKVRLYFFSLLNEKI